MKKIEFSDREKDVLRLKIAGFADKAIAQKLKIQFGTVRKYLDRAKLKCNCRTNLQLALHLKSKKRLLAR